MNSRIWWKYRNFKLLEAPYKSKITYSGILVKFKKFPQKRKGPTCRQNGPTKLLSF